MKAGLDLTERDAILKGGDGGPAVDLGKPADSLLLQAVNYSEDLQMPPKGKLPQAQIDVLTEWVKKGLPYPKQVDEAHAHGPPKVDDKARQFWAFRPVRRPDIPAVKESAWVRNPVDAFVLAGLESQAMAPAPPADKAALIRRVYYSVIGLPPTPEEVRAFVRDDSPTAYERLVDRLLASRHYGEHWGRHWLDLVRFAESNSFERDGSKPFAWRFRDYVIASFNADKPYDQFVREQLAGDELDRVTPETMIATGYYRLGLWDDEPADPEQAYYDGLDDILATTGQTFLGLTVNCSRCHDHKIDPLPQRDYYRMLAFFHGVRHYGVRSPESVAAASLRSVGVPDEKEHHETALVEHQQKLKDFDDQLKAIENLIADKLPGGERDDFAHEMNKRPILRKHIGGLISQDDFARYEHIWKQKQQLARRPPKGLATALVVTEQLPPRETFVFARGNHQAKAERVEPGFPSVLTADEPVFDRPAPSGSSGRRRVLADWIADRKNPLTARVLVNRVWQYHFGRGIVRSSSNFGYQGTPPTHPELLDWLADEFVARGWRLKDLHRLILTSSAYRQSSRYEPSFAARDPENDRLWRFDPRRLTAEEVRDSILAVCGNLNRNKTDGPSVFPPIPAEVMAGQSRPGDGWGKSSPEEAASRSVFVFVKRSLAVPLLAAFDAPDPDSPCPVRFVTTQPAQALAMLNSQFIAEQARIFRDAAVGSSDDAAGRIRFVVRGVTQREPSSAEIERGLKFLAEMMAEESLDDAEALRRFCLLALNFNEFVTID